MTKKQAENYARMERALIDMGIDFREVDALRRIEMTLSRWGARECGDEHGNAIERDEVTGKPYATYERSSGARGRYLIADKETGALKRLDRIMAKYPELVAYHQGDPRGCSLYVVKRSDIPQGEDIGSYYTRGIAVCI